MSERAEFCIAGRDLLAEPYHYRASGLDYVFLLNGVTMRQTPYGPMVAVKNPHGLHRAIGLHIVENPKPMAGLEFRFLRKQMGLTQRQLATWMRTSEQTVANYEKGKTEPGPADAFMRMAYFLHIVPEGTPADVLKALADRLGTGPRPRLPDLARRKIVQRWREGRSAA